MFCLGVNEYNFLFPFWYCFSCKLFPFPFKQLFQMLISAKSIRKKCCSVCSMIKKFYFVLIQDRSRLLERSMCLHVFISSVQSKFIAITGTVFILCLIITWVFLMYRTLDKLMLSKQKTMETMNGYIFYIFQNHHCF